VAVFSRNPGRPAATSGVPSSPGPSMNLSLIHGTSATNVCAEIDLKTKARAMAKCEVAITSAARLHWRDQPALTDFLRSL
jgi:hypothetical protein